MHECRRSELMSHLKVAVLGPKTILISDASGVWEANNRALSVRCGHGHSAIGPIARRRVPPI